MRVLLLNSDKLVLAVGAGSETDGPDRGLPASAVHVRLPKSEPSVKHCHCQVLQIADHYQRSFKHVRNEELQPALKCSKFGAV